LALIFARVELPGEPSTAQYETLHKKMSAVKFNQTIVTEKGTFKLPHATCASEQYASANAAAEVVKVEADLVVKGAHVLTRSGSDRQGINLEKIAERNT